MSVQAIHQYRVELDKIVKYGGTTKETAIRSAFFNLLNEYAKPRGWMMVAEISIKTRAGKIITPDGTLKDSLRLDWGYWESKDEADDLKEEIEKKFAKGYPKDNILFEDSRNAVLIQSGEEVLSCAMSDEEALHRLLTAFFAFERPEVRNFREAIELFKQDIPKVTDTIRGIIIEAEKSNTAFMEKSQDFLTLCRESINPGVTGEDVREMMIQHILTEDIFNTIFDETLFHRENNIARELEAVISTFFTVNLRRETMRAVKHYYDAINAAAAGIADHHEKQKFLKVVYETFYKSYNPKAADRLGVVYTPNEIVRFMIESADYLLYQHFDKYLEDRNVEILDPAAGTGTFICDLIDYLRDEKLEYKYRNEIHANEVAILPYYISNLNIEYTYAQKMGRYAEFENLCFVDTLDNVRGLKVMIDNPGIYSKMDDMYAVSQKNSERIKAQNKRKISVIIGNPPYNANQVNENDNNKNREYEQIDRRIKDTFIKYSTAQKSKVYDMYARFYRWAFDRLSNNGIVAFITNNSFINARAFDGFRQCVQNEFQYAYIIDLGGNIRELSGKDGIFLNEKHTIFGISSAVGIAIMFLVKKKASSNEKCIIRYIHPSDIRATRDEKIAYINTHPLKDISFDIIRPDKNNNWIDLPENDFDRLLPLCSKDAKAGKNKEVLFESYSTGISTNRDEWVIDLSKDNLKNKMKFFTDCYSSLIGKTDVDYTTVIKWSRNLKRRFVNKFNEDFKESRIVKYNYRPYVSRSLYHSNIFIDEHGLTDSIFYNDNKAISFTWIDSEKPFSILGHSVISDLHFLSPASTGSRMLPIYRYDDNGNRIDNITDWGLKQFVKQYNDNTITRQDIFYYVYAVLHNPVYQKKYELNLKREFPRIPFYDDFRQWATWGEQLMNLHINYETAEPYPLQIKSCELQPGVIPKPKLKADKSAGIIILDTQTELHGIPAETWDYRIGKRSALEWILDQYREKKPKDPTIAEKFNTYRFADYKEQVIDLLKRVCTVSVQTMQIKKQMET